MQGRHLTGITPLFSFMFDHPIHALPIDMLPALGEHWIGFAIRLRVVMGYIAAKHRVAAARWPTLALPFTRPALAAPLSIPPLAVTLLASTWSRATCHDSF